MSVRVPMPMSRRILMGYLADGVAGDCIIVYDVVRTVIVTEVIFHGRTCVVDCYIIKGGVIRFAGSQNSNSKFSMLSMSNGTFPLVGW